MLGLDVQEKSQLQSLESSLSNTVNHKWPILHVHFIDEPISNWNITENPKHLLPHTQIVNRAEFIHEPGQTPSTGCLDYTGSYSSNSAVMLGTVERAAPMDISGSTQKIDHQELSGSSVMQYKEDCLQIGVHPEDSAEQHVKDKQTLSEPEEAAQMEDISAEVGLHSEHNAKQDNVQRDRNKSSDLKETNPSAKLTEMCSLMVTELQKPFDQPPCGPEKYNVVTSSEHTCLSNDLKGGGSCMCLEDQKVPLCSFSSHDMTNRNPDVPNFNNGPVLCEESLVCKESKCSDFAEIDTESILGTKESRTETGTKPKENNLDHAVTKVATSTDILDVTSCSNGLHEKDDLCKPLSNTHLVQKVKNSFEDTNSQQIPDDLLSECGKPINFPEAITIQPNLLTSTEQLSAKSLEMQECSFVLNAREYNPLHSGSTDPHEDLSCANNLPCKLDESSNSYSMDLVSAKNAHGESSFKDTTCNLLADDHEISAVHFRASDATLQKITIKIQEQLQVVETFQTEKGLITKRGPSSHDSMTTQTTHCTILQDNPLPHILNEAPLPVTFCPSQTSGPHSILPNLGCDTVTSCNTETSSDCVISIENDKSAKQQAESNIVSEISDSANTNATAKLDNIVVFGHIQSSENDKTILRSPYLREVHCPQTPPECQSAVPATCPLQITLQNALVPYVDIWSFLTKPKVSNVLSLNSTHNMILKKAKFQKAGLRNSRSYGNKSSFLYAKACSVTHKLPGWENKKHALLLRSFAHLESIKTHLLKCPNNTFKIPKKLLYGHFAWSHRVKKSDGVLSVDPNITQTKWVSSSGSEAVNLNLTAYSSVDEVRCLQRSTSHTLVNDSCLQKTKTPPPLSNNHNVQCTALQADILASSLVNSNMEHTQRMKPVVSIKPMVTRSRKKIQCNGPSEYLHILKPAEPSTSPKGSTTKMESILCDEQKPPFKLLKSRPQKKSPFEITSLTLKHKRVCMKTEQTPTTTNRPLPLQCDQQVQKDCLRQPTCSKMEMKAFGLDKSIKNCTLKLEPRSLTCTTPGTKRPKTSHVNFGPPSSSDIQSCIDTSSHKTFHLHSHSQRPSCKVQNVSEIRRNNSMTGDISLRKQPSRKCKSSFIQEYKVPNSSMQTRKLPKAVHAHTSNLRLLPSKSAGLKRTCNTLHARVIKRGVVTFNKCSAETRLLQQLSAIASKLTVPCKSSPRSTPLSSTTKLLPFRGVQLQARKLLNVFSCVNMQVSSQSAGSMGSSSRDHLFSQRMDPWSAHIKVCPDLFGSNFSFPTLDNTTFPVSFHMKVDPGFLTDFITLSPPDYMVKSVLPTTRSAQLSEWTLSFFLSPQFPASSDAIKLFTHCNPHFKFLGPSESHSSCRSKSERKSGCSMLGLHTVLALSSPGCYRLWTRKRNLGSRIPTVHKLSMTQFAHGLKGLPPQFSWKREISSSLAFALGRVMSMWSRHGLSALSSDASTPHCSSWQPSQSLSISVPAPGPSTELIPKNCFTVNEASHHFNVSSSWLEKYLRPSHCISTSSNHANCLFLEEDASRASLCSVLNKQGKDVQPPHCFPSQQLENLFGLSTEQAKDLDPPVSLSTEQIDDLGHLHCLSIEQDDDLKSCNFFSSKKAKNILSPHSRHFLSPGQEKDALLLTNSLPLDQVDTCEPPCQVSTKQVDGFGPSFNLSIEHGEGPGHIFAVSIQQCAGLAPLSAIECRISKNQHGGTKPQHHLIIHQDVPQFPSCSTIEQKMGLGHSKVLSSEQVDGLKSSCSQEADGLEAPLPISAHEECEFGTCNLSILQNNLEPPCMLMPSKTQARPFEQRESLPIPHAKAKNQNQEDEKEGDRKPQRVSQIRIRKTIPKPDPNLTPMGLPKPKRINKKEFSLEDIYTNKNYKSPPPARSLETIFEEPKEKNGVLVSVSQTKRKRILEFRDCTMPRPKRAKGKVRVMTTCKRGRKAAMEGVQLDALLIQKLMDLENFLLEQETFERGSASAEKPS